MLLGIDPGKDKIGWVLTDSCGDLFLSGITKKEEFPFFWEFLKRWEWRRMSPWVQVQGKDISQDRGELVVVVGNGTMCRDILDFLEGVGIQSHQIHIVEERGSTLEARNVFWDTYPPKGLWRLIPVSLRTPYRDIDDLAAFVIVRRFLTAGQGK